MLKKPLFQEIQFPLVLRVKEAQRWKHHNKLARSLSSLLYLP